MENLVYITTNLINGKKYIGSTNGRNPYYLGSGVELKKDIKKLGAENFKRQILWEGPNKFVREIEEYWIEYFDASNNELFYNKTALGTGPKTKYSSIEEAKIAHRQQVKEWNRKQNIYSIAGKPRKYSDDDTSLEAKRAKASRKYYWKNK